MSHLLREHAPITETGWEAIDDEARSRLTPALAARKLVDFAGPHGWEYSATNLGLECPRFGGQLSAGLSGPAERLSGHAKETEVPKAVPARVSA